MTVQEMKERKAELGFTNEDIARKSGIPLSTVNKFFGKTTRNPRRSTILAIESVLTGMKQQQARQITLMPPGQPTGRLAGYYSLDDQYARTYFPLNEDQEPEITPEPMKMTGRVMDGANAYNAASQAVTIPLHPFQGIGEYTIDDYLALPEGTRAELIDGYLYAMAAPTPLHQLIATLIGHQMMSFVEENNCPCVPISSPVDVQLHKDNKTMVQPDIIILCSHDNLLASKRIYGAPDFAAEILSPSNRHIDMTVKLFHYLIAGVREYVGIWENRLSVDFEKISDYLEKLK